ncbi:probable archaetidylglycerolphosphate synthase [Natronomonas pharaonis DSM 2160]|uniref:Probable archaetidylglycerolphosphate synthase n=1 Tax=Natronomonas pharaonis (strain ATCC 35678 / DSM 2160 / CIP 103997 / JCM 8858 / NBRC 14720 / NCIMB 2260 / Gabara) TaxID=348780 RepID=Q3IRS9_NATPD|nr:CDP-alcohol phosphatidyltransferase family protein [Natronomonas pharaonis]CAI49163.1 probable archaetidylglycerolphosphate synthase [Natronomonas pharaonis DSM 2160]
MTLDKLRPVAERVLNPFVAAADRVGLTPDGVSVIAFGFAVAAAAAYTAAGTAVVGVGPDPALYLLGALFVLGNGWMDLLDGALARRQGTDSKAGDLLDHVLDRYADIVVVAGLAAGAESYLLGLLAVTGVLMTSYLGTQAQAVGLDRVYGGLVGRADRLAVIGIVTAIAAGYPEPLWTLSLVEWLLVFLAVVGHLTALQRFYHSMRALS